MDTIEHLHIVTTCIRGDGTLISDRNNFEKSRRITDDLERKYGLYQGVYKYTPHQQWGAKEKGLKSPQMSVPM